MSEADIETLAKKFGHRWTRRVLLAGAAVLGVLGAAFAIYYAVGSSDRPPATPAQAPAATALATSDSFSLSFLDQSRALPELRFADAGGRALTLGDFRGRVVVLNLWATWCIPCRKEMPALDGLQAAFDKSQLLVVPLSIDRQGVPAVKQFYQELGLKALGIYIDQSGKIQSDLNAVGLPTTVLIDRDGREVARKIGPAEWDSPKVIAVLRKHFGLSTSEQKESP